MIVVSRVQSKDSDSSSDLHYSWVGSEAFDENGVIVGSFEAEAVFSINEISGDVFVVGPLDREVVEKVRLRVAVEDFAAELEQQVRNFFIL
jgi:hypothetical protein